MRVFLLLLVGAAGDVLSLVPPSPPPPPGPPRLGPPELVFPGGTSRGSCASFDLPDAPARAWRDASGTVHLAASWATSRFGAGPSLSRVAHTCDVAYNSSFSGVNALYEDNEWILAPYALDGDVVMALAHQEYHGWENHNCSAATPPAELTKECWMVAITLFASTDGGYTFKHAAPAPAHLVANAPYEYVPNGSGYGYGDPSGIAFLQGFYYLFVHSRVNYSAVEAGTSLMRAANLSDPRSWRCWDGSAFEATFVDPYAVPRPDPATLAAHVCTPIAELGTFVWLSLKFSTFYGAFVMVGQGGPVARPDGTVVENAYVFTLSAAADDLLHWGPPQLLREKQKSGVLTENYASLLDEGSPSKNFDTVGQNAYFYFTAINSSCRPPGCRDLMRQPVVFAA